MIDEKINAFVEERVNGLDPYLNIIERDTHLHMLQPHMLSGRLQAAFLKMIVVMLRPTQILELGTYTAYSTLAMAEALTDEASITTIECDMEVAQKAKDNISQSKHAHKITLLHGEAKLILPELLKEKKYNLIFIDADKESNQYYYDLILATHSCGTVIIIDNVLWKGKVVDDIYKDKKTESIKKFIQFVSQDDRVDSFILPIRDGIYMVRIN